MKPKGQLWFGLLEIYLVDVYKYLVTLKCNHNRKLETVLAFRMSATSHHKSPPSDQPQLGCTPNQQTETQLQGSRRGLKRTLVLSNSGMKGPNFTPPSK